MSVTHADMQNHPVTFNVTAVEQIWPAVARGLAERLASILPLGALPDRGETEATSEGVFCVAEIGSDFYVARVEFDEIGDGQWTVVRPPPFDMIQVELDQINFSRVYTAALPRR